MSNALALPIIVVDPKGTMKKNDTKFKPGESGNPRGRPKGSLNKTTMLAKALLDGQAEELVQALINKAIKGNVYALRLAIERLIPISRERAVSLPRSNASTSTQITEALQAILDAVSTGEITPSEAQKLSAILENKRKAIETAMFEDRIAALEKLQPERTDDECPSPQNSASSASNSRPSKPRSTRAN